MHMKYYHLLNKDFKDVLGLHQFAPLTTDALNINKIPGKQTVKLKLLEHLMFLQ